MNFKDNLPIYIQIMNYIKKEMVLKRIKEGQQLPSVRELSSTLTVNPNTIQRAYTELERENLVFTQRGMGTFATEDKEKIKLIRGHMAEKLIKNFLSEMKSLDFTEDEIIKAIDKFVREE